MARWRFEALRRLPELKDVIEAAPNVAALWDELWCSFEEAYRVTPWNESLIARLYSYADWCVEAPQSDDPGCDPFSAVVVGRYEDIPNYPPGRDEMPRWLRYTEVKRNKQVFAYLIGGAAYGDLLRYMAKHHRCYRPRGWAG